MHFICQRFSRTLWKTRWYRKRERRPKEKDQIFCTPLTHFLSSASLTWRSASFQSSFEFFLLEVSSRVSLQNWSKYRISAMIIWTERLHVTGVQLQDAAAVSLQTNSCSPSAGRHCDISEGQLQHESRCSALYLHRLTAPNICTTSELPDYFLSTNPSVSVVQTRPGELQTLKQPQVWTWRCQPRDGMATCPGTDNTRMFIYSLWDVSWFKSPVCLYFILFSENNRKHWALMY